LSGAASSIGIIARTGSNARFACAEFFDAGIENDHPHAAWRPPLGAVPSWLKEGDTR
jgi:hypothetical protein